VLGDWRKLAHHTLIPVIALFTCHPRKREKERKKGKDALGAIKHHESSIMFM